MLLKIVATLTVLSSRAYGLKTRDKTHSTVIQNLLMQEDEELSVFDERQVQKCHVKEVPVVPVLDGEGTNDANQKDSAESILEKGPDDEGDEGALDSDGEVDQKYMDHVQSYLPSPSSADFVYLRESQTFLDVAIGPDGSIWMIEDDQSIHFCRNDECRKIDGSAVAISVDSDGVVYIITSENEIYSRNGPKGKWEQVQGEATDIAARSGTQHILGTDSLEGGKTHTPYHKKTEDDEWTKEDGALAHIAGDSRSLPSGIGGYGGIWQRNDADDKWQKKPGAGKDLSIGYDDTLYVIGNNDQLYKWNKNTHRWIKITGPGKALKVDVMDEKNIVVLTENGKVKTNAKYVAPSVVTDQMIAQGYVDLLPYPECFNKVTGDAVKSDTEYKPLDQSGVDRWQDIAVAADGTIWALGDDDTIWYSYRQKWRQVSGAAVRISIDTEGTVWVVNRDGLIYKREGGISGDWENVGGSAHDIAARNGNVLHLSFKSVEGADGRVMYLSKQGAEWERVGSLNAKAAAIDSEALAIAVSVPGGLWKRTEDEKGWSAMTGCGSDISIAHDGTLFVIGFDGQVYRYDEDKKKWQKLSDLGVVQRIDALDKDTVVVIDEDGKISTNSDGVFLHLIEDGDGSKDDFQKDAQEWEEEIPDDDAAAKPELDQKETIDPKYMDKVKAYKENLSETPFYQLTEGPSKVGDVAYAPDGTLWLLGADNTVWFCREKCRKTEGRADAISVDSNGIATLINHDDKVVYSKTSPAGPVITYAQEIKGSSVSTRGQNHRVVAGDDSQTGGAHSVYTSDDPTPNEWKKLDGFLKVVAVDSHGSVAGIAHIGGIWSRNDDRNGWKRRPGSAKDISFGFDDSLYIIGNNDQVYFWNEKTKKWILISGVEDIKTIDVLDKQHIAAVGLDGKVYSNFKFEPKTSVSDEDFTAGYYDLNAYPECFAHNSKDIEKPNDTDYKTIEGGASKWQDVAIGADGIIWALGQDSSIWFFKKDKWRRVEGGAVRISVDSNKNVWVVNEAGAIFKRAGISGGWSQVGGSANDISARNGNVLHLTSGTDDSGARNVYVAQGGSPWAKIGGFNAATAAVDPKGLPYITTINGGIWKRTDDNDGYTALPGCAADISVSHDGVLFAISKKGQVFMQDDKKKWLRLTGLDKDLTFQGQTTKILIEIQYQGDLNNSSLTTNTSTLLILESFPYLHFRKFSREWTKFIKRRRDLYTKAQIPQLYPSWLENVALD